MHKQKKFFTRKFIASRKFVKYSCLLFAITFVSLLVICIANYILADVKQRTFEQYSQNARDVTEGYAALIQYSIRCTETELRAATLNPAIRNGTDEQIASFLVTNHDNIPESCDSVAYANLAGESWSSNGNYITITNRDYYNDIVKQKGSSGVYGPVILSDNGMQVYFVSLPVYDSNQNLKGILSGAVRLDGFLKLFQETHIGNVGSVFLIDQEGRFLYMSNPDYIMKTFVPTDWMYKKSGIRPLSSTELARIGRGMVSTITPYGEEAYAFLESVPGTAWTVGLSVTYKKVNALYDKLNRIKNLSIGIAIAAGTFFIFLTMIILNHMTFWEDIHDPLTGLWNRVKFEKEAQLYMDKNPASRFLIAEIDFNGFKFINQNYGTQKADELLKYFARIFKNRTSGRKFMFARGYADHFYLFREIMSVGACMEYAEEDWNYVEEALMELDVSCCPKCGYTFVLPDNDFYAPGKTIQELIGDASYAKSTIKGNFLYRYCIFSKKMATEIERNNRIERNMGKGLDNNEFYIVYQPKMGLGDEKIHGAEALVRWNSSNPKLGYLSPSDFIPLFEKNNFIVKLDFAVFEMVFKFLRRQIDLGNPVVPISVNVSRKHSQPEKFVRDFVKLFNKYNLPAELIEVELLERSDQDDAYSLRVMTETLHRYGFSVAMDDFGSGHSSLNMLNQIPVDVLKFDQKFLLKNDSNSPLNLGMITTLVDLGRKLNKRTLFEGVETREQRDFLRTIKCDEVQGYFYSRPLSEKDFVNFVQSYR